MLVIYEFDKLKNSGLYMIKAKKNKINNNKKDLETKYLLIGPVLR